RGDALRARPHADRGRCGPRHRHRRIAPPAPDVDDGATFHHDRAGGADLLLDFEVLDEGVHDAPELRRILAAQPVAGAARLDLDIELHGHPLVAAAAAPRAAGAILVRRGAD